MSKGTFWQHALGLQKGKSWGGIRPKQWRVNRGRLRLARGPRKRGYYGKRAGGNPMKELKFDDTAQGAAISTTTGTILQNTLLIIPEGVGEEQRIGRKINLLKLQFRGRLFLPTTTAEAETTDIIRLIVYHDKQCNRAAATVAQLLQTSAFDSWRNMSFTHRFSFLYDRSFAVNITAAGGNGTAFEGGAHEFPLQFYIPLKGMPIIYNSSVTTGVLTSIESNNIGFMIISSSGNAGVEREFRIRFTG